MFDEIPISTIKECNNLNIEIEVHGCFGNLLLKSKK